MTLDEIKARWNFKYGESFVTDLNRAANLCGVNLSVIARKYKLSREYVSKCFHKLHGKWYKEIDKVLEEDIGCPLDPKQKSLLYPGSMILNQNYEAQIEMLRKFESMGFCTNFVDHPGRLVSTINVNGYHITTRVISTRIISHGRFQAKYFQFHRRSLRSLDFDFIVFYIKLMNEWYIIPIDVVKSMKSLAFRANKPARSIAPNSNINKVLQYKNNWEQLRRKDGSN